MKTDVRRVSDLALEQYALGELPGAERPALEAALERDAELRSRLDALESSNQAILSEYPPAEIAASIRRGMLSSEDGRLGRTQRRFPSAILLSAAAAVLVLAGAVAARSFLVPTVEDLTRPKGGAPGLAVYRKTASGAAELGDGTAAVNGDLLQLRYGAGAMRYGAILSLDGRGVLTRHFPDSPSQSRSPQLASAGAVLEEAYQLDDAPLFERFFIFSADRPFDLSAVEGALRDLARSSDRGASGAPRLPSGLEWRSLLLRKPGGVR